MIAPYARTPAPPRIGYVLASGRVGGERDAARVYVGHERASALLLAGEADAICWNGDPIRLRYAGHEAIVLRTDVPGDVRALDGLVRWRDFLASHGAAPASFGSAAWSLLRASLDEPIRTSLGDLPPLRSVIGGRQEVPHGAGRFADVTHHDLTASYPAALSGLAYGGAWSWLPEITQHQIRAMVASRMPVFVSARVVSTDHPAPLPRRPRGRRDPWEAMLVPVIYPTGPMRGFWTGPEIVAALDAGSSVRLRGGWAHGCTRRPFERWWAWVQQGRALDGFASTLGKITGNALWGQLCISSGERAILSFRRGKRVVRPAPLPGQGRPRVLDLAETITGMVRARLYDELICPAGEDLIVAHTDGGWTRGDFAPTGEGWRVKDHASRLDLINAQAMRWRSGASVRYAMAGVPTSAASDTFAELWARAKVRPERG